jgi:hypothetical protein
MTLTTVRRARLPDLETCWALLERVAASSQLRRAARLQELLFYVGKRSLKDGCDRIHEQEIGSQVFGRPESYDTTIDNIVRTNVSDLRKRIDAYFNSEGLHEKLIMEIPRGNYVPVFKYRSAQAETVTSTRTEVEEVLFNPLPVAIQEVPQTLSSQRRSFDVRTAAVLVVVGLAIGSALYNWNRYRVLYQSLYAWQDKPAVATLWSQILTANPNTDIVISDTSIGLTQTLSHNTFLLKEYLSHSYVGQLQAQNLSPDMRAALNRILAWNLGSPDEFNLARRILALDPLGKSIHLYNARNYMPDLIKRDNVILVGARKSNPWEEIFESRTNFITKFNDNGSITVINRSPAAGEQQIYTQTDTAEYCVVAYLPNPDSSGIVLLINGTDAEATEAAGDFLLAEDQLSNFKKTLHTNNFPYFEVLLKVSSVRGTPLTATIDAYRIYSNSH